MKANTEDKCVIITPIYNFMTTGKTCPMLTKLHQILKSSVNFQGGLSSLRKVILNVAFKWKKIRNNKSM